MDMLYIIKNKTGEAGNNGIPKSDSPQCGEMSRSDRGDVAVSLLSLWR